MGARALVQDAEVAGRLRAFLNFDNTGASGPSLLYETAAASAVVHAWAAAAPAPAGASFATEIYKRLPNDTDFTILKRTGAAGLNFAVVGDAYAYHTDRDVAARVPTSTLQRGGDNTVGIVRDLDARMTVGTAGVPAADATYFDVAGARGVVYSARTATILTWLACLAGLAGWLRLTRDLWQALGFGGVVRTMAWAVVAGAAVLGALLGAALTMRLLRAETNYWYATPVWSYAWIAAAGVGAAAAVGRLSAIVPPHLSPWRGPAAVWWVALPIWMALTTALELSAPVASYVFALPLLVAAIAVLVTGGRATALRVASALVVVVVLAISASKILLLMKFVVPLFGWLPVAAPLWLQPALVLVAFVAGGPPILALIGGGASQHDAAPGARRDTWPRARRHWRHDVRGQRVHRRPARAAHCALRAGRSPASGLAGRRRSRAGVGAGPRFAAGLGLGERPNAGCQPASASRPSRPCLRIARPSRLQIGHGPRTCGRRSGSRRAAAPRDRHHAARVHRSADRAPRRYRAGDHFDRRPPRRRAMDGNLYRGSGIRPDRAAWIRLRGDRRAGADRRRGHADEPRSARRDGPVGPAGLAAASAGDLAGAVDFYRAAR